MLNSPWYKTNQEGRQLKVFGVLINDLSTNMNTLQRQCQPNPFDDTTSHTTTRLKFDPLLDNLYLPPPPLYCRLSDQVGMFFKHHDCVD